MTQRERPFMTSLSVSLIEELEAEKQRTRRPKKFVVAAFLKHCLAKGQRERDRLVAQYLGHENALSHSTARSARRAHSPSGASK